ncbi:MAG: hypothetical protein COV60_02695 [Candidatus Magasanikbacteria bacterium CG11_big_fil_rev_8_21_14_0_20_43_7]|uniref:Uncharacterized protein n=1 Tax=Candidatus Magasanikbacteria bacterium CG11_big_fil_rev_8_21_14_0_20_43_7 TaxID=1974654 RepID=A0A2H0N280_9BACT|nr:MAG: hypothetical protein COV60_02695 [Candidatus Magasanikbacteria bacterium CG11_big_fil_rev_8_21_14_0_20_43_7]
MSEICKGGTLIDQQPSSSPVDTETRPPYEAKLSRDNFASLMRLLKQAAGFKINLLTEGDLTPPTLAIEKGGLRGGKQKIVYEIASVDVTQMTLLPMHESKASTIIVEDVGEIGPDDSHGRPVYVTDKAEFKAYLTRLEAAIDSALEADRVARRHAGRALSGIPETVPVETGRRFDYNLEVAERYGMEAVELPARPKAQELFDKIIANDLAFLGTDGTLNREEVQRYWDANCTNLPNIPKESFWYFKQLARGLISDTIDEDDKDTVTKRHIPSFGEKDFVLVMNFPEKDARGDSRIEIIEKLFNTSHPTGILREKINVALWEDHDAREQSLVAKVIIAELLDLEVGASEIAKYELRLIRPDEYARLAQSQNYGNHDIWTHMDGYNIRGDGRRDGLIGGDRGYGGAACVDADWRDDRRGSIAVRLVLQRKR